MDIQAYELHDRFFDALVSADLPVEEVQERQDRVTDEGGDCVVVPTDFDRGRRFHEAFGGMGAILRFPIE